MQFYDSFLNILNNICDVLYDTAEFMCELRIPFDIKNILPTLLFADLKYQ